MKRLLALTTAILASSSAFGQLREAGSRPTAYPGPNPAIELEEIDGVAGPQALVAGVQAPGERIAPDILGELFELPPTEPREPIGADDGGPGPLVPTGYVEPAPEGLLDELPWQETIDGGWVVAIELFSPNAEALRVRLNGPLSVGLELRVYDPVDGFSFGPDLNPPLDENGDWWTTIIFGESIGLEFSLPAGFEPDVELPAISAIAYIHEPLPSPDYNERGCAHNDVTCFAEWASTASAVTMLATVNGSNVTGYCTGALLNRGPGDLSPLVMTANHCVGGNGGQATANSTAFIWLFETPACNGTAPNPNSLPRSNGSLILKRHTDSDWNLLGLYQAPGANWYLGWSSGFWDDGSLADGVHHPGGTFKRISFGSKFDERNQTFCDANGQNCFDAEVWDVDYFSGFTQPGSSGSPVFDSSKRVRGTLSGGPNDDCSVSRYGRFDLAYANLRYYLSNTYVASPMFVNGGFTGDGGNNGSSERGTPVNPFNTVYESSFAVIAGDDMLILPGSYNEQFTIRRPMTLNRWGSSGVVTIGQ